MKSFVVIGLLACGSLALAQGNYYRNEKVLSKRQTGRERLFEPNTYRARKRQNFEVIEEKLPQFPQAFKDEKPDYLEAETQEYQQPPYRSVPEPDAPTSYNKPAYKPKPNQKPYQPEPEQYQQSESQSYSDYEDPEHQKFASGVQGVANSYKPDETKGYARDNGKDGRLTFAIHGQQGPNTYRYGFDTGNIGADRQFRFEERDNEGVVHGRYGYYDTKGKLRIVNYKAHPIHGFSAEGDIGHY